MSDKLVSKNFHLSELTHSNTAVRLNIDNTPSELHIQHLEAACVNLWQPARDLLDKPMLISSGYRSPKVNKRVGGSATSAHSIGYAIDFTCPKFGSPRKVAEHLVRELNGRGIKFDQLILEFPETTSSWVHLGYKNGAGQQRGQVLTAKKQNGKTVYLSGLV